MLLNNDLKKEVPVGFFFYTCPKIQKVFKSFAIVNTCILKKIHFYLRSKKNDSNTLSQH